MSDGMRFTIRVESNSQLVLDELGEAVERALYAIGVKAVEGSVDAITGKKDIPSAIDTGRLRASISFITPTYTSGQITEQTPKEGVSPEDVAKNLLQQGDLLSGTAEKNTVVVGSNVEYAEYVHNGTSRMEGRPFLREGIDKTKDQMQEQAEKIFKGQL